MAAGGGGGLEAISAGIAEALITTAFGLLVALPAVWLYNYFINRIDYVSMEMTYATKEFMDFLLKYEARLTQGGPPAGPGSGRRDSAVGLLEPHGDPASRARMS